jgi:hypothetical protein
MTATFLGLQSTAKISKSARDAFNSTYGGKPYLEIAPALKAIGLNKNDARVRQKDGGRINYALGGSGDMPDAVGPMEPGFNPDPNAPPVMGNSSPQLVDMIQSIDDPEKKINTSIMLLMQMGEEAIPLLEQALTTEEFVVMSRKLESLDSKDLTSGLGGLNTSGMMTSMEDDDMLDPDAMQTDPEELMREIQSQGAVQTARAPSQEGIMSMMRG